jgi:hypothetical protein
MYNYLEAIKFFVNRTPAALAAYFGPANTRGVIAGDVPYEVCGYMRLVLFDPDLLSQRHAGNNIQPNN